MRDWEISLSFVFFVLTVLIAIYMVIQMAIFPFGLRSGPRKTEVADLQLFQIRTLEPLEKYRRDFSTHALFPQQESRTGAEISGIDEALKSYMLIGVVQGIEPEALIQNRLTMQTHFVQAGESFDQFKLVKLKERGVVVEYQGEQRELNINYEK